MVVQLPGLSPDILESILLTYCDSNSLAKFWQALAASNAYRQTAFDLFLRILELRFRRLPTSKSKEVLLQSYINNAAYEQSLQQQQTSACTLTRHINLRISTYEFCKSIPNVVWCGHMEFKDPLLPDWSTQHAKVVLYAEEDTATAATTTTTTPTAAATTSSTTTTGENNSHGDIDNDNSTSSNASNTNWKLCHVKKWRHAFPVGTKLISQMYNFVPVQPRGRLCGITESDKVTLQDISKRLESRDQVMTLRYRNDDGLILRMISPEQARRRLAIFSNANLPGNNSIAFRNNSSEDGLVCCWESLDEEDTTNDITSSAIVAARLHAMRMMENQQQQQQDDILEPIDHITRTYNQLLQWTS